MQLISSRLERVDIYTPERVQDSYIGTKSAPKLLGFVYADIQPLADEISEGESGKIIKRRVKLILRPDAGVQCGDLASVYGDAPVWEITEVKRFSEHISATAVHL